MTTIVQFEKTDLQELIQDCIRQVITEVQTMKPEPRPDNIGADEACQILGFSRPQLYKLTSLKEIPVAHFGKRLVFSRKAITAWMEANTILSTPENPVREVMTKTARKRLNL